MYTNGCTKLQHIHADALYKCARALGTTLNSSLMHAVDVSRLVTLLSDAKQLISAVVKRDGVENVFAAFNGGKDSVVALHLLRLSLSADVAEAKITNAVYFCPSKHQEFPQVASFVDDMVLKFNLRLQKFQADWHQGLSQFSQVNNISSANFVIGCRKTDDGAANYTSIQQGSIANFNFVRIHPLLEWNYADVWNFIRLFNLDYCSLYDRGYTSLGSITNTQVNPHLKKLPNGTFAPAYTLEDWAQERAGRVQD